MTEMNLITLKCSNCSASLKLSDKLNRFICNYCGTEQLLSHNASGFFFKRLEEKMESLEKATEKGNAELALKRLREDMDCKTRQLEAVHEEKVDSLHLLKGKRESAITTAVVATFFQAIILKVDSGIGIYLFFQLGILGTIFFVIHDLGKIQKEKDAIILKYRPELERINNEIEFIEIKIKKKIKFVDG